VRLSALYIQGEERVGGRLGNHERCFLSILNSTPALLSERELSSVEAEASEKYEKSFIFLVMHIQYSVHICERSEGQWKRYQIL
jgi:hypothetical protein